MKLEAELKTPYRVKNLSNQEVIDTLLGLGACQESIEWIRRSGKNAQELWLACNNPFWVDWLLRKANGAFGLPTPTEWFASTGPFYAEYTRERLALFQSLKPDYATYRNLAFVAHERCENKLKALILFVEE